MNLKSTTALLFTFALSFTGSLALADEELEIEFRLHPDSSGMKTQNQGIKIDRKKIEIYLDGDEKKVDSSSIDTQALFKIAKDKIKNFALIEGNKVRPPYIEVKIEYGGEDREIEISQDFPAGKLPKEFVELQKKYLRVVWE